MKPFSHLVRRTHLYLALLCMPWFVMYGVTAVAFSHPDWFPRAALYDTSSEGWSMEGSWDCTLPVPDEEPFSHAFATSLVELAGMNEKAFGAYRSGADEISVYFPSFSEIKRLVYRVDERRLRLYRHDQVLQPLLTGMHARAGYQYAGVLNDAWAVMVDLSSVGFLLWVATGLYIWWQSPKMRIWGALALVSGVLAFAALLWTL